MLIYKCGAIACGDHRERSQEPQTSEMCPWPEQYPHATTSKEQLGIMAQVIKPRSVATRVLLMGVM